VTVLKVRSASALYGSDASSGVIVITLQKSKTGGAGVVPPGVAGPGREAGIRISGTYRCGGNEMV